MVHYYGGVTEFLTIDNQRAGVIKPDLWDPQINRTLSEVVEYYGTFINPCMVKLQLHGYENADSDAF